MPITNTKLAGEKLMAATPALSGATIATILPAIAGEDEPLLGLDELPTDGDDTNLG